MNPVSRGIRNAFRNGIRTLSIVIILGLSIGLCLTMLIARAAVDDKIATVKSSIGNTISISPAGVQGFQGGGNPLSETTVNKLTTLSQVTSVTKLVDDQLRNTDGTSRDGTAQTANTSLVSAIDAGNLGRRFNGFSTTTTDGTATAPAGGGFTFTPPVSAYGTTDTGKLNGSTLTLKSGTTINGSTDTDTALIGSTLATKNNLKVGSTFTAYGTTITVAGIFDSGTTFGNNAVVFALPTLQRLSSQTGNLTSATVTVDSVSDMDGVTNAVKQTLGSSADVTSSKDSVASAVQPLDSVKTIAIFSLIGAIVASVIIILLTMIMVVRERKREIGIVKAIGGSNLRIMGEFMVESLTLAVLGALVGLIIGIAGAQPVTKLLVTNSANSQTSTVTAGGFGRQNLGGGAPLGGFGRRLGANAALRSIDNVKTQIGWLILLEGFGAALLISIVGSSLTAGLIAKIRPNEVMRSL